MYLFLKNWSITIGEKIEEKKMDGALLIYQDDGYMMIEVTK